MIEMELKASLHNKSRVEQTLEILGCKWTESKKQIDVIYLKETKKQTAFRIRITDNKKILTLKTLLEDRNTAQEYEVGIDNETEMEHMLNVMGYFAKVEVVKHRKTTTYGAFTLCIDEVEGVGDFIEVEYLAGNSVEKDRVYEEMKVVLFELGVGEEELRNEKYYEMVIAKNQ